MVKRETEKARVTRKKKIIPIKEHEKYVTLKTSVTLRRTIFIICINNIYFIFFNINQG